MGAADGAWRGGLCGGGSAGIRGAGRLRDAARWMEGWRRMEGAATALARMRAVAERLRDAGVCARQNGRLWTPTLLT